MSSKPEPHDALISTAEAILKQTSNLSGKLAKNSMDAPSSLALGATSSLWTTHDDEISSIRSSILSLTQHLDRLLEGPHGFLHEYVSTNWEYGALYTLLEFSVLEKIPLDGSFVCATELAEKVNLPPEKLLRICRLVATAGILLESEEGRFAHTAISETLFRDEGYRSFIRFQLFETRVASAHLADSLREENPFWTGRPAFDYAWGMPMYTWHAQNSEKGARFAQAMESVSKNLDPGNGMIIDYLTNQLSSLPSSSSSSSSTSSHTQPQSTLLVEINGKTGSFSTQLATLFPSLDCIVQDPSLALVQKGQSSLAVSLTPRISFEQRDLFAPRTLEELESYSGSSGSGYSSQEAKGRVVIFLLRGVLWNLPDEEVVGLLKSFIPVMGSADEVGGPDTAHSVGGLGKNQVRQKSYIKLLISDLVSPTYGTFAPYIERERPFRRRDVTLMTMHNVKQRTAAEWDTLIGEGVGFGEGEGCAVSYTEKYSSHSCRGLWEITPRSANGQSQRLTKFMTDGEEV